MNNLPEYNEQILLNEGLLDKLPVLAALGLASVLGSSELQASKSVAKKKPFVTTNIKAPSSMFGYISQWEGIRNKVYKDHTGKPTIGVGHYLNNSEFDKNLIKSLFNNKVDYDGLLNGTKSLSNDQVEKLFKIGRAHV